MKALKRGGWGKGNKHPSILKKMAPKMGKTRPKAWASLTHCSPPFVSFHLAISKFSPFSNFPLFNSIPLFPFSFIQPVSSIPKFKMESSHQNWHQRRMKWAAKLEEVLNDFDALQLFQSWMGVDDDSSEHPLRLHFAIVAFREMLAHSDPRAAQLAREIYNKFLRPKSGLCAFIDVGIRERIGQMLRQNLGQKGGEFPADLFDECLGPLDTFLRKQHALFVTSQEFLDKFNNSLCLDDFPSPSSQKTPIRRPKKQSDSMERPPLTADMLLRSQKEREAMVPANSASQRLFKPVSKFPYIGQTQPSKNDSAVSSAISSEANNRAGGNYSLRLIRKEQTRINPPLMATFPRLDQAPAFRTESQQSANQFRHDTSEGRQQFADLLFRKLQKVELRHRHEESVKEQIELLNSARQKGAKQSARELIGQSGPELLGDDSAGLDADEELESYYRVNMAADSNSSANSAQQSPLVPISRRMGPRSRGGHGSCSPPPQMLLDWNGQIGGGMSQSCCSANPSTSMHHSTFLAQSQKANRPPIPPPHHQHHFPLNADSNNDRSMLSSFPHFGIATQFSPFCPQQIPCPSTILHQPLHSNPIVGPHPPPTSMPSLISQSMHLPNSAIPQPKAPSTPLMGVKCKNPHGYCDNDCDTSGIGSMTSATHSGTSAPGSTEQRERQRAAVFRKARELSSGGGAAERQKQQQSTGMAANSSSSGIPRQKVPPQQQSSATGSLPRPTRAALPQQPPTHQSIQNAQQQSNGGPKMTISYRESGPNGNGVPVVAQIPRRPLTFREFRRFLSISSKDHRQFFFKVSCEDGSAPYQLLLVNDDHATLPIFEGKITAECRATLTDSD